MCPPRPASIIGGTKHSRTLIGPIRLTSTIFCQWLCSRRSIAPQVETPAMFITTSMLPWAAWTSSASATTASWSATSAAFA